MNLRIVISVLILSAAIAAQAVPNGSELPVASADNSSVLSSPAEPTGNPFSTTNNSLPQNLLANSRRSSSTEEEDVAEISISGTHIAEVLVELSASDNASLWPPWYPGDLHLTPDQSTHDYSELMALLERWALQDPYNAMKWLVSTATDEQQQMFEQNIVHTLLPDAASTVYEFRENIKYSNTLATVERHMAMSMAKTDPALAFEWALELQNDSSRLWALSSVAHSWIREDHNAVIERFALLNDPQLQDQLINRISHPIASALVTSDPYHALDWTDTLSSQHKQVALPAIFNYWLNDNQEEARLWLRSLPESEAKGKMRNHDFWHALNNDIDYAINSQRCRLRRARVVDGLSTSPRTTRRIRDIYISTI